MSKKTQTGFLFGSAVKHFFWLITSLNLSESQSSFPYVDANIFIISELEGEM